MMRSTIPCGSTPKEQTYTVYILRTEKDTLYVGQTNNLERRLREHRAKKGRASKYLRRFQSIVVVHTEAYLTRREALQREWQIRQMKKREKEQLLFSS